MRTQIWLAIGLGPIDQTLGNVLTTRGIASTAALRQHLVLMTAGDNIMPDQNEKLGAGFFAAFARPAWVVMMVAQMLLGLALAIALIMKYYMLVFGTVGCMGDDTSIANAVRCTPTMVICAHFLIAMAAVRFAAFMFVDKPMALLSPLMVGLAGLFLLFMTGVGSSDVTWALAAVILAFLGTLSASIAAQVYLSRHAPKD